MMGYVSAGVLVYGTGYYYPPVIMPGPMPIYYPYPYTYAGSVWYNPSTGAWARGGTIYGPYGGARPADAPTTRPPAPGRRAAPSTARTAAPAHGRPITRPPAATPTAAPPGATAAAPPTPASTTRAPGVSGSTNQNANPYGRWGSSTFTGPNQTVNTTERQQRQRLGRQFQFQHRRGRRRLPQQRHRQQRRCGQDQERRRVCRARRQRLPAHRQRLVEIEQRRLESRLQPPAGSANRQSGTTASNSLGGTQQPRSGGSRLDSSSYQQLEHDRLGRQAGQRHVGDGGGFGGGRFRQ